MPINKQLIAKKLGFLNDQLTKIERMQFDQHELEGNTDIQDLLTFRLQQSVETSIDIATHIIAALDIPRKETAKDAFLVLGKEKIINQKLADKMGKAADFRNRDVHGYNDFDYSLLFKDYKDNTADLRDFGYQIVQFLKKTK